MMYPSTTLGEIVEIPRDAVAPEAIESGTTYVGLENITGDGRFAFVRTVEAGDLASTKFIFTSKHILYGKLRPYLRKIARPDFEGICSTDILPILPGPRIDRDYLCHFLRLDASIAFAESRSVGANLPRISPRILATLQVPLPPMEEQQRIAALLDKADVLRQKRRLALQKLDSLTQSIFLDMFGDPTTNPKHWRMDKLGNVCDVRDGTHDSPKYVYHGVPLVTSKNLTFGRVDLSSAQLISNADFDSINRRSKVDLGDILMPMIGTIGNPVIVDDSPNYAIKNVALVKFLKDSPLNDFVHAFLSSDHFGSVIKAGNRGGTQKFLSLGDIRSIELPKPPRALQDEFGRRIKKVKQSRASMEASFVHIEANWAAIQHRAFQGEL